MEDLIFTPLQVPCPKCFTLGIVSIESLLDNEEVICQKCNFDFIPNIDVNKLLQLIKAVENSKIIPNDFG